MTCSDWIQLGLLVLTLVALATAWIQPRLERRRNKNRRLRLLKRTVSLYLDAFELKLEKELKDIGKKRRSLVLKGKFEEYNRKNYDAIEDLFKGADELDVNEANSLMEFIRYYKTSPNMENKDGVLDLLKHIRETGVRDYFPEGVHLKEKNLAIKRNNVQKKSSRTI